MPCVCVKVFFVCVHVFGLFFFSHHQTNRNIKRARDSAFACAVEGCGLHRVEMKSGEKGNEKVLAFR